MSFSVHSPSSYSTGRVSSGKRCGSGGRSHANRTRDPWGEGAAGWRGGLATPLLPRRGSRGSRGSHSARLTRARYETFLCIPTTPGDQAGGTHASNLLKGTNVEKKHSQQKQPEEAKALWAAKGPSTTSIRERLRESWSLSS